MIKSEWDKIIEYSYGGEISEFIRKYRYLQLRCVCSFKYMMDKFVGYPHDGGLKDKNNHGWWVYTVCPRCKYEMSFHKIPARVIKN
jgi:hypothetical protein